MSILDIWRKIKPQSQENGVGNEGEEIAFGADGEVENRGLLDKLFLSLVVILVASLSFGIGRLTVSDERMGVSIEFDPQAVGLADAEQGSAPSQAASVLSALQGLGEGSVVVSKNGTKYHYPHCSGAKQIKEENKIVFETPAAAESAGYTLAANCKPR